eukprot:PhF_6_TR4958/c0_g1_i1/m.7027
MCMFYNAESGRLIEPPMLQHTMNILKHTSPGATQAADTPLAGYWIRLRSKRNKVSFPEGVRIREGIKPIQLPHYIAVYPIGIVFRDDPEGLVEFMRTFCPPKVQTALGSGGGGTPEGGGGGILDEEEDWASAFDTPDEATADFNSSSLTAASPPVTSSLPVFTLGRTRWSRVRSNLVLESAGPGSPYWVTEWFLHRYDLVPPDMLIDEYYGKPLFIRTPKATQWVHLLDVETENDFWNVESVEKRIQEHNERAEYFNQQDQLHCSFRSVLMDLDESADVAWWVINLQKGFP